MKRRRSKKAAACSLASVVRGVALLPTAHEMRRALRNLALILDREVPS